MSTFVPRERDIFLRNRSSSTDIHLRSHSLGRSSVTNTQKNTNKNPLQNLFIDRYESSDDTFASGTANELADDAKQLYGAWNKKHVNKTVESGNCQAEEHAYHSSTKSPLIVPLLQDRFRQIASFSIRISSICKETIIQVETSSLWWNAKRSLLDDYGKVLVGGLNYGFYWPAQSGRAGKFLDESRQIHEYPFHKFQNLLQFRLKQRLYKDTETTVSRKVKMTNSRASRKQFVCCIQKNDVTKVRKFLERGLDPNFCILENAETPMSLAVMQATNRNLLMALVEGGAHLDLRNEKGFCCIHTAAMESNREALQVLLDLGASCDVRTKDNLTPLYLACCTDSDPEVVEMLLRNQSSLDIQNSLGWTELHQVCRRGLSAHVEHLIFYGSDLDVVNDVGNTSLHLCAVYNKPELARILVFRGASRDICNNNNQIAAKVSQLLGNNEVYEAITGFSDEEIVPFRESPSYVHRRPFFALPQTIVLRQKINNNNLEASTDLDDIFDDHQNIKVLSEKKFLQSTITSDSNHSNSKIQNFRCYEPRIVVLNADARGFGFTLKGVIDAGMLENFSLTPARPAFQYLDKVDPYSVAAKAGLRSRDFILSINGDDTTRASHQACADKIRASGDVIALEVITVKDKGEEKEDVFHYSKNGSRTLPSRKLVAPSLQASSDGPDPPNRSPGTSLSRVTSLSLFGSDKGPVASIRVRPGSRILSVKDLESVFDEGKVTHNYPSPPSGMTKNNSGGAVMVAPPSLSKSPLSSFKPSESENESENMHIVSSKGIPLPPQFDAPLPPNSWYTSESRDCISSSEMDNDVFSGDVSLDNHRTSRVKSKAEKEPRSSSYDLLMYKRDHETRSPNMSPTSSLKSFIESSDSGFSGNLIKTEEGKAGLSLVRKESSAGSGEDTPSTLTSQRKKSTTSEESVTNRRKIIPNDIHPSLFLEKNKQLHPNETIDITKENITHNPQDQEGKIEFRSGRSLNYTNNQGLNPSRSADCKTEKKLSMDDHNNEIRNAVAKRRTVIECDNEGEKNIQRKDDNPNISVKSNFNSITKQRDHSYDDFSSNEVHGTFKRYHKTARNDHSEDSEPMLAQAYASKLLQDNIQEMSVLKQESRSRDKFGSKNSRINFAEQTAALLKIHRDKYSFQKQLVPAGESYE